MKLHLTKGTAYTIEKGERVSITEIEAQGSSPCECRLDCCLGGMYIKDIATGTTMVGWIENGVWNIGTIAQFNTARANY